MKEFEGPPKPEGRGNRKKKKPDEDLGENPSGNDLLRQLTTLSEQAINGLTIHFLLQKVYAFFCTGNPSASNIRVAAAVGGRSENMKKVFTALFFTALVVTLVLAAPAFACACGPLPTSSQQQGSGSTTSPYSTYNQSEPCTWPADIRPASCPQPTTTK